MSVADLLEAGPPVVIAEACDNHFGSMDRARRLIDAAQRAGADVVKFQHHLPDAEMLPDVPLSDNFDEPLYDFLSRVALSIEQHEVLRDHATERGIVYLCTPFSIDAARELAALGVREMKVGSGELRDLWFLEQLVEIVDHAILSTGMCSLEEIDATVRAIGDRTRLSLMSCTSAYPTRHEDVSLKTIASLRAAYPSLAIGQSDHTPDNYTCFGAVALGARLVEKHFTLDRGLGGPDASVSLEPDELADLVRGVRAVYEASQKDKAIVEAEVPIRRWAYRSVVTAKDVPAGAKLEAAHIRTKRPGTGIPSARHRELLGRRVRVDLPRDHLLAWEDLEDA